LLFGAICVIQKVMTRTAHTNAPHMPHPLERLEQLLHADMLRVNAMIIERFQSDIPLIPRVAAYLIAAGGKRIRPLLTLAAAALADHADPAQNPVQKADGYAASVEFIHTATLLHDDVVDESEKRRGQDSANIVFGNQASVLVGDFLFSKSFELMVEGGSLRALDMLARASATIAEGEVLQMSLRGDVSMTRDQYMTIIECKTAALFRAATQVGGIVTGQSEDRIQALYDYGQNLGMCFQIADDMMDYASTEAAMGKNRGDDFREGKITLPVLIAMERAKTADETAFWNRVLKDKAQKDGDFDHAIVLIHQHGAMNETYSLCEYYAEKAKNALDVLTDKTLKDQGQGHSNHAQIIACLYDLVDFVVRRDR